MDKRVADQLRKARAIVAGVLEHVGDRDLELALALDEVHETLVTLVRERRKALDDAEEEGEDE